jgi:CRISPR-associated protein Cmr6
MVIGIGEKGPLEVGLTLNHTWGVPYIPGSALKGIAAATASKLLQDPAWLGPKDPSSSTEAGESYEHMFGLVSQKGCVVFHDAWWDPKGERCLPLKPDVMTVHHADYYQKDAPPSDTDSPNPVSFVSVIGTYLIVLEGESEWCEAAADILRIGTKDFGIGAKTRAGYGRLALGTVQRARV